MRLGGPVFGARATPGEWVAAVRREGYRAAACPVGTEVGDIGAWAAAARAADIVIAEVGAWSNPLSEDAGERATALDKCKRGLDLAERIGAVCCVNISGSRGAPWDGPDARNLTDETFEMIVACVRDIIDSVAPRRAFYALETMPWMYPDGPDSYLRLIAAIDRPQLAVHLDPVNMISNPQRFLANGDFIRECFDKLGPYIKTCHAKDITLGTKLTVHLDEVRPGLGALDYRAFLTCANRLHPDLPVLLEHLPGEDEYRAAAAYVRSVADELGIPV